MICKSKHNSALNQVEKVSMRTKKSFGGTRKRKLLKGQDKEFISENVMTSHFFFDLYRAYVPVQLISVFKY